MGLGGCAHAPGPLASILERRDEAPARDWLFFQRPGPDDPWRLAIGGWQLRQRAARRAGLIAPFPAPPATPSPVSSAPADHAATLAADDDALVHRYDGFLAERRRRLARDVLDWIQDVAHDRFVEDGPIDRWPTLIEVLHASGDDCDGLELLAYHALRQLGFEADRVYRAIVLRPSTGEHHMVTLWFEDPTDPWVLDPTATMTTRLRRLSELEAWIPLKLFNEDAEFTVGAR
jgi:hypothetical protein